MLGEDLRQAKHHPGAIENACHNRVRTHQAGEYNPAAMSYGSPVTLETAKQAAVPAMAEARKNQWTMVVAIVDPAGDLVYFERMDDTQVGSVEVAISKARSAARFKRPTKAFQDALAGGGEGWRILGLSGAVAVEGGLPLVSGGKIIGAIGVSGGTSAQDGQVAAAGAAVVK
jgi:uncharacterized protein GlcG (DUF336 family)